MDKPLPEKAPIEDVEKSAKRSSHKPGETWKANEVHVIPDKYVYGIVWTYWL
jgi:hypothetical protein